MAATNGYCTTPELQSWNQATSAAAEALLDRAIEAASRAIDEFCQRHFWKTSAATARDLVADDPCTLVFGAFNDLHVVTAVATDAAGDGTFETAWSAGDYELHPVNPTAAPELRPWTSMSVAGSRRFPLPTGSGRQARVRVTGTWGWAEVPAAVEQACLLLAARLFLRKESPAGVAGFGEFGAIRVRNNDPDVAALLGPYQRYPVLVA
jgi:hypothetical protein